MIDAVSTVSLQNSALRSTSHGAVSASAAAATSANAQQYFVSSRVRMDNLLDLAILEYRSSDTGDVIRQYPSESQIRAFQRASELEERAQSSQEQAARSETILQQVEVGLAPETTSEPVSTPQPAPQVSATPAPSAPSTSSGTTTTADTSTTTTQSVTV